MLQRDVVEGIHRVEEAFTNWYLVEDGDSITIVDAGFPAGWHTLARVLGELGRKPSDVEALVITHAHPDHIGFAELARTEWQVPLWLHERDRSISRHPFRYETEHAVFRYLSPRLLKFGVAMAREGVLGTQPLGDVRAFADEDELDVPGRPRPVHTPGHTHGHTAFHFADRGAVIAGDALSTAEPYTGKPGPRLLAGASNADSTQALASLQRIADTAADVLLVGHGLPWTQGAQSAVDRAREAGPS